MIGSLFHRSPFPSLLVVWGGGAQILMGFSSSSVFFLEIQAFVFFISGTAGQGQCSFLGNEVGSDASGPLVCFLCFRPKLFSLVFRLFSDGKNPLVFSFLSVFSSSCPSGLDYWSRSFRPPLRCFFLVFVRETSVRFLSFLFPFSRIRKVCLFPEM